MRRCFALALLLAFATGCQDWLVKPFLATSKKKTPVYEHEHTNAPAKPR